MTPRTKLQAGIDALRQVASPAATEPEPTDQLLKLAKTMRQPAEVAKAAQADRHKPARDRITEVRALTADVVDFVVAASVEEAVAKGAAPEPPRLRHVQIPNMCRTCQFYEQPACTRYAWVVDPDEVCDSYERMKVWWSPLHDRNA